ncbi:MAG: hypothetical protein K8T20_18695 [Planctomycetes bacterium]|nr:hypothetical protein [Planctomycetota bacterium]
MTAWNRFWFSTSRRYSIGFFRILLCTWLIADFIDFLPAMDLVMKRGETFMDPCAGLRWIGRLVPPLADAADFLPALRIAACILAPLALVGLGTRFSLFLLALVNFTLRSYQNSWTYVGHASILPSIALFVLVVAPGVKAWSLDALLEAWRARRRGEKFVLFDRLAGPPAAVWPVHLILATAAIVYFSSGVAKVRWSAADWTSGRTLQWYLQGNGGDRRLGHWTQFFTARRETPPEQKFRDPWGLDKIVNSTMSTPAGRALGSSLPACACLAWATLLLELAFPALFFLPRPAQYALLAAATAFHAGIGVLMGIDFGGWATLFLAAVDWNAVLRRAGEILPGLHASRRDN